MVGFKALISRKIKTRDIVGLGCDTGVIYRTKTILVGLPVGLPPTLVSQVVVSKSL